MRPYKELVHPVGWRVDALQDCGFIWVRSVCLGVVAEGQAGAGRIDEALATLDEAFHHASRTGERLHEAALLRLRGELLLRSSLPEPLESERCFLRAIELAEREGARSWDPQTMAARCRRT
jgi:hypothetical protein